MRTDSLYLIEDVLRSAQVVSIIGIAVGIIAIVYRRLKVKPVVRYLDDEKPVATRNNSKKKNKKK